MPAIEVRTSVERSASFERLFVASFVLGVKEVHERLVSFFMSGW